MAWYPGAERMELQPESDAQPAIRPTQVILHSIAAPWTPRRMYEYWRDSTNLESHFGLGFDGTAGQYIGTQTKADANMYANRRPDGSGAISIESASNLQHTDPWTPEQVAWLIDFGVWAHRTHDIPLRACRSHDDPGFGYHSMFPQWSDGGTACPGDARRRQFHDLILPGIARAVAGQPPIIPTTPEEDIVADEATINAIAERTVERLLGRRVPRLDASWAADPAHPDLELLWPLVAALPNQERLIRIETAVAAQTAVLARLLDDSDADTASVLAAIAAAGDKAAAEAKQAVATALASGIKLDVTATAKEN